MNNNIAIEVKNLSKRYRIGLKEEKHDTLGGALASWIKSPFSNFRRLQKLSKFNGKDNGEDIIWALRDISFSVKQGEVVGIIGRNGAGKSTLLKILSRIAEPTSGRAIINGRFSSLLEVGTGFHPDLTGRENIYLNGTILGMSKTEIESKFDEIVAFSEVERFLDTPVKRYSSGMTVRLAFSVAAHLEPEILMVDEVLAVGDVEFQKKCLGKMGNVAEQGRTVLFVSHNMAAVSSLCQRAILLKDGCLTADDSAKNVIDDYLVDIDKSAGIELSERTDRTGRGHTRFTHLWIENSKGEKIDIAASGQEINIVGMYKTPNDTPLKEPYIAFAVRGLLGEKIADLWNESAGYYWKEIPANGRITCRIPKLPLNVGTYRISIWLRVNNIVEDAIQGAITLTVVEGDFFESGKLPHPKNGFFLIEQHWQYDSY